MVRQLVLANDALHKTTLLIKHSDDQLLSPRYNVWPYRTVNQSKEDA